MISHCTRFRENDDLSLWRGLAAKKKPSFLMHKSHVKLCAVGMRNAILGMTLIILLDFLN